MRADIKEISGAGRSFGYFYRFWGIFGFDITDISGSIRLFSDVMNRLGIRLAGDELYEEFQRIYDESVGRDAGKEKAEDNSSADLFYNLEKVFEKSNKVFYNEIEIIYNRIVKLYS